MVRIDVQVALAHYVQIERAMVAEQFQHVVQKADSGVDVAPARAVQIQLDLHVGLARFPADGSCSCAHERLSCRACKNASFSVGMPTLTRRQSSSPGAEDKSRIKIPCFRIR